MGLSSVFGRLTSLPGGDGLVAAAGAASSQLLAGGANVMQDLSKVDLSNARDKVQEAARIKRGDRSLLSSTTLISLEPNESRLLFQFLKAVADFHGVSYLSSDRSGAPSEQALSFGGELSGREYLEKFNRSYRFGDDELAICYSNVSSRSG